MAFWGFLSDREYLIAVAAVAYFAAVLLDELLKSRGYRMSAGLRSRVFRFRGWAFWPAAVVLVVLGPVPEMLAEKSLDSPVVVWLTELRAERGDDLANAVSTAIDRTGALVVGLFASISALALGVAPLLAAQLGAVVGGAALFLLSGLAELMLMVRATVRHLRIVSWVLALAGATLALFR